MKPHFKWLLLAATLVLAGVVIYGWVDLHAAPVCQGDDAIADPQAPIVLSGWGFDPANTRAVPEEAQGLRPQHVPARYAMGLSFPVVDQQGTLTACIDDGHTLRGQSARVGLCTQSLDRLRPLEILHRR